MNFDGLAQDNKAGAGFVIRNCIGELVRTDNIHVTSMSMLEFERRGLKEAICCATSWLPSQCLVVEEDALDTLTLFLEI